MAKHRIYTLFGTLVSFPPAPKKNVCASTCFSRRKVLTPPIRIWNFQCGRLTFDTAGCVVIVLGWELPHWCRNSVWEKKPPGKKQPLLLLSINFIPKTSHSCQKEMVHLVFLAHLFGEFQRNSGLGIYYCNVPIDQGISKMIAT